MFKLEYMAKRSVRKEIFMHLFTNKDKRLASNNVWKIIVNNSSYIIVLVRENNEVQIDKNWINQNTQTSNENQSTPQSSRKKKMLPQVPEEGVLPKEPEENPFQSTVVVEILYKAPSR
jgi:hypothetical protein